MSEDPWHRRVSPIFFLLLLLAGLMIGFVGFLAMSAAVRALGG